jgi:hypothetical protein
MKIELSTLIPVIALAGGIIFTYGQLTGQVDALELRVEQLESMAKTAFDIYSRSD